MSFAVTATSKALAAAGIDHIVTEGGRIIVEAAYDADRMVPAFVRVVKEGNTFKAIRSKKKTERFADYQRKLMKARRDAGYAEIEKKHRDKPHTKRPAQKKSMEKAWTKSPKLLKIHKKHEDKEKARRDAIAERALKRIAKKKAAMEAKKKPAKKSASKPAAKKASKPAAKKVAPKKPVAKKGFGGKRKLS
jgi:hypothetical protein